MPEEKSNIAYTIRRSRKAKRILLKVNQQAEVELVLPRWASERVGKQFFQERLSWVRTILRKRLPTQAQSLASGAILHCFGVPYRLVVEQQAGRSRMQVNAGELLIRPARLSQVKNLVEKWYREEAKSFFETELVQMKMSGIPIRISGAKTRWGSCNIKKRSLMLNWRLALAPIAIARYVLCHELAHLQEHNHSPAFWRVVATFDPDFQEHRAWLKHHGHTLRI